MSESIKNFLFSPRAIVPWWWIVTIMFHCPTGFSKEAPKDEWLVRENLVTRLGGELYKIGILERDLQCIQEILLESRDIELLPSEMTRLRDDTLIAFDKRVEIVMKKRQALSDQINGLKPPLLDAIAILREMVVGQPVEDMFQVLDNDDIRRISVMFDIKHYIDNLWKEMDGLLSEVSGALQISLNSRQQSQEGSESEFFDIVRANLGLQSERFSKTLDEIKDSLYKRGSDDQRVKMFRVETRRIKLYLKSADETNMNKKISTLIGRYQQPWFLNECNKLMIKNYFKHGAFDQVIRICALLPDSIADNPELMLLRMQSLHFLKNNEELWRLGKTSAVQILNGSMRNKAIWLTMESGLALGKADSIVLLASQAVKDSSYALHILHCLGRNYMKLGDWKSAQGIFESAPRLRPQGGADEEAFQRISLSIAQIHYERKDYTKALTLFFDLLNHEKTFAQALFGISWCYIALGDYPKAETTLRKLINQAPWSPLSADALLLTMQRFDRAAKDAWEKYLYLTSEERRLVEKKNALLEKATTDSGLGKSEKYRLLVSKIDDLLSRLQKENRPSREDIASYYDKISQIAKMINAYYGTGTFQEVVFSEKRERLLRRLDSLIIESKEIGRAEQTSEQFSKSMSDVNAIKNIVLKSRAFAVEALIDRFRWERDYIDWQKTNAGRMFNDSNRVVKSVVDSSGQNALFLARKRQRDLTDSLVKAGDKIDERWRAILTEKCSEVLASRLDSMDESYIRYHLGEIHYGSENEKYARAFAAYEDSMTVFDSLKGLYREGKYSQPPKRPSEPRMDHRASREQYEIILGKHPESAVAPAAKYGLAWCYNDQGLFDSAETWMDRLVQKHPSCQYAPQAWMYIGEYMFDHSKLQSALKAYQTVLKYPESEWFDKALYKLAWTQYRLSNPEKAIGSFLALVDLGEGSRMGKTLLEKESIDYIAISFSETDLTGEKGLERARNFVSRFGDRAKGAQILHRLAGIFKEQGRFEMAQKTYATLLRMYPENKKSPLVEAELLAVLEKSIAAEDANIGKIDFFNKYNKNGSWAKMQDDPETRRVADSLACKLLYDASLSCHQLALRKNDSATYAAAEENYRIFINNYPRSPQASECHYNLAEIMFSLGDYSQAAEEYITVSKLYPDSKYKETAAWNAIVASQNLLKKEKGSR